MRPRTREGADGQAVVCPLLRGSLATRGVAPKQHEGSPACFLSGISGWFSLSLGAWVPKLARRSMEVWLRRRRRRFRFSDFRFEAAAATLSGTGSASPRPDRNSWLRGGGCVNHTYHPYTHARGFSKLCSSSRGG